MCFLISFATAFYSVGRMPVLLRRHLRPGLCDSPSTSPNFCLCALRASALQGALQLRQRALQFRPKALQLRQGGARVAEQRSTLPLLLPALALLRA